MRKAIKRIICVILIISLCSVFSVAAENGNVTIYLEENELLSGTASVTFYSPSRESCKIKLDGEELTAKEIRTVELHVDMEGVDNENAYFSAENVRLGNVTGNGELSFVMSASLISDGILAVDFVPSTGTTNLNTSRIYGKYNIDDVQVNDIFIKLPSGETLKPDTLMMNYPIVGQSGVTQTETAYTGQPIVIGDGWFSDTGLGGSTPDVAISFSAIFDFSHTETNFSEGKYLGLELDTTQYQDGSHILEFSSKAGSSSLNIIFDNTAPSVQTNVKSGALLSESDVIELTVEDTNGTKIVSQTIDGNRYREGAPVGKYVEADAKTHLYIATVEDSCGNTAVAVVEFSLKSNDNWNHEELPAGSTVAGECSAYSVTSVNLQKNGDEYTFNASLGDELFIEFAGTTEENVELELELITKEGTSSLARIASGDSITVQMTATEDNLIEGKITLVAKRYVYESESQTMVWVSDTQYYTAFENLQAEYESIINYYVDLYENGEAGYLIHTGDVADDYTNTTAAKAQFVVASKLHKILEDLGIPYGIVNGNHDVGQSAKDNTNFAEAFPASRFNSTSWFYGNLRNNESHYDLISLGGYDFVLVWLGYGVEADPETVAWANDVLERYSHRNAIILTHAYLDSDGTWLLDENHPEEYRHSRAREIWEEIVVPNSNVLAVFCGHVDGVSRNLREVDESRSVWEVLADYQYAEVQEPTNVVNGETCDGEGFVRLVTFDGQTMTQKTYSPYLDCWDYYSEDEDEFTVEMKLLESTKNGMSASVNVYKLKEELHIEDGIETSGIILLNGTEYTVTVPEGGSTWTWLIWIGVAVVLVAALAGSAVIIKKKKKE